MLTGTLAGCIGYVDRPGPAAVYVAPVAVEPVIVVQDEYVYYPSYGMYYNSYRHQYVHQERGSWVSRPSPRGVSVEVLHASPSVRMDFHDSPGPHHAAVVQKYPKKWAPPGNEHGRK